MNEQITTPSGEDAAWAAINTPLTLEALLGFCEDVERLFRINPLLEFSGFEALGAQRYRMQGRNISQSEPFEFDVQFSVQQLTDGLQVEYEQGIKSSTRFSVEPAEQGARLTITDHYERLPADEREQHLHQVDKSLVTWADYLQRYMISWSRWSKLALWRWYMRRIWQPMKPAARRVTYTLLWISVVEVALITLGVAIYFAEYR